MLQDGFQLGAVFDSGYGFNRVLHVVPPVFIGCTSRLPGGTCAGASARLLPPAFARIEKTVRCASPNLIAIARAVRLVASATISRLRSRAHNLSAFGT